MYHILKTLNPNILLLSNQMEIHISNSFLLLKTWIILPNCTKCLQAHSPSRDKKGDFTNIKYLLWRISGTKSLTITSLHVVIRLRETEGETAIKRMSFSSPYEEQWNRDIYKCMRQKTSLQREVIPGVLPGHGRGRTRNAVMVDLHN